MNIITAHLLDIKGLISSEELWQKGSTETVDREGHTKRCLCGAIYEAVGKQGEYFPEVISMIATQVQKEADIDVRLDWYASKHGFTSIDIGVVMPEDWINAFNDYPTTVHKDVLTIIHNTIASNTYCNGCEGLLNDGISVIEDQVYCNECMKTETGIPF